MEITKKTWVVALLVTVAGISQDCLAYSEQMRKAMIAPPWEIVIQSGKAGSSMKFPVEVKDVDKITEMDRFLPIMGSPVRIKITKYLPSIKWSSSIADKADGGVVCKMNIKGPKLDQTMLLDSEDTKRWSINSSIGSLAIKKIHNPGFLKEFTEQVTDTNATGILTVRFEDKRVPLEYIAAKGRKIEVKDTPYKIEILEYYPHYSVDRETKNVTNQSERPVNPAVKIRFTDGKDRHEKWIWAKFPDSPHDTARLPVKIEFFEMDFTGFKARYILLGAPEDEYAIVTATDNKRKIEKFEPDKKYPFSREGFVFSVGEIRDKAVIKDEWKNVSEEMLSPALIATVQEGEKKSEYLLELNKPKEHKSESETILLGFRKIGMDKATGMPGMPGGMKKK